MTAPFQIDPNAFAQGLAAQPIAGEGPFQIDPNAFAQGLAAQPIAGEGPGFAIPKPTRLIDRIRQGTHDLLGDVRRRLAPTPAGYEGLLDPSVIEAARPSILQSLIGAPGAPSPTERYAQNLDRAVAGGEMAQTLAQRRAMLQNRARVEQMFAPVPNETRQQAIERMIRMQGEFARFGDTEMVGKLGETLKSIGQENGGSHASLMKVDAMQDGKPVTHLVNPITGETVRTVPREADRAAGLTPYQEQLRSDSYWRKVDGITSSFERDVERAQIVSEQLDSIQGIRVSALRGNAMAQMALIFSFMRLLDPNSAVREGEYQKAEMLRGIPDIVRNAFNKARSGQFLSEGEEGQIQKFLDTADQIAEKKMRAFDHAVETLRGRAKRRGINPDDVIFTDYFQNFREQRAARPATPATGTNPLLTP